MLKGKTKVDFKKAVFTMENAWYGNQKSYTAFSQKINNIAQICQGMVKKKGITQYKTAGNWAVYMWMKQKIPENNNQICTYDFEDFYGNKDFSSTFVMRLLKDKKGNCVSLPLLYKCIAQDLNIEAKLTLGPSHCWIRHKSEEGKWTNVELTSGQFPTDGLMMTELGIKTEAIKIGAYFKALTEKESLAFLLTQLALSYDRKFGRLDEFTDKCVELSIKYYPPNVVAYMIKSNRLVLKAQQLLNEGKEGTKEFQSTYATYKTVAQKLLDIGAEELQPEEYSDWVKSMKKRKE